MRGRSKDADDSANFDGATGEAIVVSPENPWTDPRTKHLRRIRSAVKLIEESRADLICPCLRPDSKDQECPACRDFQAMAKTVDEAAKKYESRFNAR